MTRSINGADTIPDLLSSHTAQLADMVTLVTTFGAKGDGVNDDTTAIQNAINSVVKTNGGRLLFSAGTYKITSALTIPFGTGFIIEGLSRSAVTIKQFTDNTPIFQFTNELTHSWMIKDITFDYANIQPSANTLAIPIYFSLPSGSSTNGGMYNFEVLRCTFNNGYFAISQTQNSQGLPIWGVNIQYCIFGGHLNGAIYLQPSPSIGQPEINIENCYIQVSNMTQTPVQINSSDSVLLKSVEFNGGSSAATFTSVLAISSCLNVTLINCRVEQLVISSDMHVWDFPSSNVTVIGCEMTGITVNATHTGYLLFAGTNGKLSVHGFGASGTMNGGCYACQADTLLLIENVNVGTGITRYLYIPKIDVDYTQQNATTKNGDINVTLTVTSNPIQYFNTNFTANRTLTLPGSGLYDGLTFTIVSRNTAAFTLQIVDPVSGKNLTIPASTKARATYRAVGSGEWLCTDYSTGIA